jgi:ribosomal protein S18 acetylase RimI-like enzyme
LHARPGHTRCHARPAAREREIGALALDVYAFNAAARRMYERAGFVAERTFLSCGLEILAADSRGPRDVRRADQPR